MLQLARPEWLSLLLGVLASLASSTVLLLTPIAFGRVLDIVSSFHRTGVAAGLDELTRGARRLLLFYLIGALCRLADVALMRVAGETIVASLRTRVFSKIIRADVAELDSTTTGELMSRMSSDTTALQRVMTDDVVKLLQGGLEALVGCVMLFVLCRKLAVIVYLTVPLTAGAGVFYGNRTADLAKKVSTAFANASGVASEQLNGIRIVKSFAREGFAEAKYNAKVRDVLALGKKAAWADAVLQMWNRGVFQITTCAILLLGGRLVAAGSLSVGAMMAYVLYTSSLMSALGKFSSGVGEFIRASGSVDRIMKILGTKPSIEVGKVRKRISKEYADIGYGVDYSEKKGVLEFRDVSFKYPRSEREILKKINFEVPAGGSIAFVGGSGAEKSTTLSLLSRFYDPSSGEIALDSKPLNDYDLRGLRENIVGIVSQSPYVIAGTIAENIAFGREDATREEIEQAATAAGVTQFANRMPDGLDTVVSQLSGGEQQRLMIARCLAKNPLIMVLDEPTSALDRRSEALVNETIERLIRDTERTLILISHRLLTVRHCDGILVFENGEVVE